MFSYQTPANLKIVGIEERSPEQLALEVEQGASFVIYSYNFSLVVMSFKRPTDIHYIPPGGNRIARGLPFTLISLLFGWWGIPWGVIYTIQTLATNFGGGTDVTANVMRAITPKLPPVLGDAPTLPRQATAVPQARRVSWRQYVPVFGVVAAVVMVTFAAISLWMGTHLKAAVVSGLNHPYTVEIDGKKYTIDPGSPRLLTLSEGRIHVRGAPGATEDQIVEANSGFFKRPFDQHVLVLNPDRLALVARQIVQYHPHNSPPTGNDDSSIVLLVNQPSYFLPQTDYFFEEFPESVSMPAGTTSLSKSRITAVPINEPSLGDRVTYLQKQLGYPAVKDYLTNYSRVQPDERAQRLIYTLLKPEDARSVFEARLEVRPLDVEWHRAYQSLMETKYPDEDILARYRALADANPNDGAALYLYARLLSDRNSSRPLYEKALHVSHPSPYAAYALAVDDFGDGDFEPALQLLNQAQAGGMTSESLTLRKRDVLFALNRTDELLAEARREAELKPADLTVVGEELALLAAFAPDDVTQNKVLADFTKRARAKWSDKDVKLGQAYLAARVAYAKGDEQAAAEHLKTLEVSEYDLERAVDQRDVTAAEKASDKLEARGEYFQFLLAITAHVAGDAAAEERHYRAGVAALGTSWREDRVVSRMLSGNAPVDHARILALPDHAGELRLLFTALGIRFPEQREQYFRRAAALNRDPNFPHLLIKAVLEKK